MVTQKILCFGELLLRLSPELKGGWIRSNSLPVYIGGAELNAATALALWQVPVSYCTALPQNYLSKELTEYIIAKKIDADQIIFSGSRIGSYYLPQGADLKNAGVIYDRSFSAFSELKTGQIDWDRVLENISWFHFSAISPALNKNVAAVCKEALQAASSKKIKISIDLNYRSKLWQYGVKPLEIMPALVEYCDLVMGNIWSAEDLLGIEVDKNIHNKKSKAAYLDHAEKTSVAIIKMFPNVTSVANTFRFDDGNGIQYYAALDTSSHQYASKQFSANSIIDKVGSGDCFMAGLIYGYNNKLSEQEIIDFAAAAAYKKLFIKGDATSSSVEEIKQAYLQHA